MTKTEVETLPVVGEVLTDLIEEVGKHISWDPKEEGLTPEINIDVPRVIHAFKNHFKAQGLEDKFTERSNKTLYNTLEHKSMGDLLLYAGGYTTLDQILESVGKPLIKELNVYPFCVQPEDNVKWGNSMRQVAHEIQNMREAGTLDFDMSVFEGGLPLMADTDISKVQEVMDMVLPELKPTFKDFLTSTSMSQKVIEEMDKQFEQKTTELEKTQTKLDKVQEELNVWASKELMTAQVFVEEEQHDGSIPEGKTENTMASTLFPDVKLPQDFEVPVWKWEGIHPDVPKADPHYIFRPQQLAKVLYAIITNQRAWLQGHTGSGKTTLIEQVCARLNWPFLRVNFDSEITRMDLIGRDTLTTNDKGETVSKFIDGILPRAMQSPAILCCDEIDFVSPDVAYVLQSALEGNGIRIQEDGGRYIRPHPMFRMMATGNTVGQGDELGMYAGAKALSLAFLDRFTVWTEVGYLSKSELRDLVSRHFPSLSETVGDKLSQYVEEHLTAFEKNEVLQPISPRGILAVAKYATIMGDLKEALTTTVIDRASEDDRAVLKGIVDRVT